MHMVPEDAVLIDQVKNGVFSAFEQLVYRYDQQVLTIAARYVQNADDAKDIYQEVFIRAYRGIQKFKQESEFSTWLYRIATNVCLSYRMRTKRHAHASIEDDNEREGQKWEIAGTAQTDSGAHAAEISRHIENALLRLSPRQRLVFTLRHFENYTLKEIAHIMDCSEGTVKRYLFIATERMRKQLSHLREYV